MWPGQSLEKGTAATQLGKHTPIAVESFDLFQEKLEIKDILGNVLVVQHCQ